MIDKSGRKLGLIARGVSATSVVAFTPTAVFAASGNHETTAGHAHEGAHHPTPSFADIIPYWINFVIFFAIFFVILRKPFGRKWSERRTLIADALATGTEAITRAENELREAKSLFATLEQQVKTVDEEVKAAAALEAAQIVAEAEASGKRIYRQSRESVELEERAMVTAVRTSLVQEIMRRAEEKLRAQVTPDVDRRLRSNAMGALKQVIQ